MLKKRLIASLLAAGIVGGVATATGCEGESFLDRGKELVQPNLIVACIEKNEQNNFIKKLHKADKYVFLGKKSGDWGDYVYGNYYDFLCSKDSLESDLVYAYPDGIPHKSEYDEMCDICFPEYSKK